MFILPECRVAQGIIGRNLSEVLGFSCIHRRYHRERSLHRKFAFIRGLPLGEKRAIIKTQSCRLFGKTDLKRCTCEQGRGHQSEISCEHG